MARLRTAIVPFFFSIFLLGVYLPSALAADTDTDGVDDSIDNCRLVSNTNQLNSDGDVDGDACDATPLAYSAPQQIAAGGNHTCSLTASGGVKCWGYNDYGQLGDGTTTNRYTPVDVAGLGSGVSAVAAGSSHACAVTSSGGVKCWGANGNGQLGDGTTTYRTTPVDVTGLSSGVSAIAASSNYTCAVTSGGGVKCWGYNGSGRLGDGTTTQRTTPVDVVGLGSGVAAITTGGGHACALTTGGGVKCWGYNGYGQLGDGTTTNRSTPVDVVGLGSGVSAVAASSSHACALTTGGGVKCWGDNYYGRLGDGTTTQRTTPVGVVGLGSGVAAIEAGGSHTCALTTGGGVKCWGDNSYGGLGDGTTTNRSTPVGVAGLGSGVSAVAAGGYHTCTLTTGGGVKCWGYNGAGQLGDGTTINRSTPSWVVGYWGDTDGDGLSDSVDLDADLDADGLANASDNCVSVSNPDQLNTDGDSQGNACDADDDNDGVADTADKFPLNAAASVDTDSDGFPSNWNAACDTACQAASNLTLDNCPSVGNIDQLDTDGDAQGNACDSDDDNDTVFDDVDNCPVIANSNQINSDGDERGDACDATPLAYNAVQQVTAGLDHTCTLMAGSGVRCWGYNQFGQLGDGTTIQRATPVSVFGLDGGVSAVVAGYSHTCALTTSGGVKCWGYNQYGQLGDVSVTHRNAPVSVNGFSGGVSAITTGSYHTCALTTGGGVKCWGNNQYGRLGDGTVSTRIAPVNVAGLSSGVSAIAAGGSHTCALTTGGGVKCWGWNDYGQLGDGTTTQRNTPVDVVGLSSGVSVIVAGYGHTCALTTGGGVKCWGANGNGQLGDGTTTQHTTPVDVVGLGSGVGAIAAGGYHTCALTTGGGVKCWGSNGNGQLGDGATTQRNTPVGVVGLGSGAGAIAAGSSHTCAVTIGGGVKCWGSNGNGQLGDGTTTSHSTPVWVTGYWGDTDGDGLGDSVDTFPYDTDNDGLDNAVDTDDDNDGTPDYIDAEPLNAANSSELLLPLNGGYKGSIIRDATTVE